MTEHRGCRVGGREADSRGGWLSHTGPGHAMKASIDHLPETKRTKLAAIANKIRVEAPAAGMIVLFGSHARGDWVEDPETGYRSDYDLLVVVEGAEAAEDDRLWGKVEAAVREIAAPTPVTMI